MQIITPKTFRLATNFTVFQRGGRIFVQNQAGVIIGDGTNPSTVIEAAFAALTAGRTWKEKVSIIGDYEITSPIDFPSNIDIEIVGRIKAAANMGQNAHMFTNADQVNGSSNFRIHGGMIDGNRVNRSATYPAHGIFCKFCHRFDISDIEIVNTPFEGFEAVGSYFFRIHDNDIYNTGDDPISIIKQPSTTPSHDFEVYGNRCHGGMSLGGTSSSGIELEEGVYNGSVFGNHCYNTDAELAAGAIMAGITLPSDSSASGASSNISISGNVINKVTEGINLQTQSVHDIKQVIIANNIISETSSYGIHLISNSTGKIHGCQIIGNVVRQAGKLVADIDGIYIQSALNKDINIANNDVSDCGRHGIYVVGGSFINVIGNTSHDNSRVSAGNGGIKVYTSGNNVRVTNNITYDNQAVQTQLYDIMIQEPNDDIVIADNTVTAPTISQRILVTGAGNAKIRGNIGLTTEYAGQVTLPAASTSIQVDMQYVQPPGALTAALAGVAGNVDNGVHKYKTTFTNKNGETTGNVTYTEITVADKTINGQVSLTAIPIGVDGTITKKVYRTKAGGSTYYLLYTATSNFTVDYTDNIADSALVTTMPSSNTASIDNSYSFGVLPSALIVTPVNVGYGWGNMIKFAVTTQLYAKFTISAYDAADTLVAPGVDVRFCWQYKRSV